MSDQPDLVTSTLSFFLDLERQVWKALADGDADADAALLSHDFLGVYPSGFAERADHVKMLDSGPTVVSYELGEPHLTVIDASQALLSYRADFVRPGDPATVTWYITSLWCERDGRWLNTFSQDTPAD